MNKYKKIIISFIPVVSLLWSQNPWRNKSAQNEMIEKKPARDMSKPVEWGYLDSLAGVYYLDQVPYSGPAIKQLEIGFLTGEFKAGLKNGLWQTLNKIGQPIMIGHFKDGRKHGKFEQWYDDGDERHRELVATFDNDKYIDEYKEWYENGNNFEYTLPNSKRVLEFKLLTHGDEKKVSEIQKDYEKVEQLTGVSHELTTRLKYQIQSVDGNTDQKFIDNFVDNEFLALDTREFRKHLLLINPDIDLSFEYTSQQGNKHKIDIPLGLDFFWPAGDK